MCSTSAQLCRVDEFCGADQELCEAFLTWLYPTGIVNDVLFPFVGGVNAAWHITRTRLVPGRAKDCDR